MLLPKLTGNIWTHKTIVDYTQLLVSSANFTWTANVVTVPAIQRTYYLSSAPNINISNMSVQVTSGTGLGESTTVQSYNGTTLVVSPDFSPIQPDTSSVLTFTQYNPWCDITLFGIPANHIIVGVKIVTLASFAAGTLIGNPSYPNSVFVFIGDSSVFPANPTSTEQTLVSNLNNTYGMSNLTIPNGNNDTYGYGSFRWFTLSGPGTTTYPYGRTSNQLGSPSTTYGSYCLPTRLDARDITARFCILDYQDWMYGVPGNDFAQQNQANFESEWNFNSNVTSGQVEITVQYMSI
jgi:hypothetical protein